MLDSIDREPIPFASVSIGSKSFNTDFEGQITSEHLAEAIDFAGPQPYAGIKFIGYKDKYVKIVGDKDTVLMQRDDGIDLHNVIVECYCYTRGDTLEDVEPFAELQSMEFIPAKTESDTCVKRNYFGCNGSCSASFGFDAVLAERIVSPTGNTMLLLKEDIKKLPVVENVQIFLGGIPGTYGDIPHFIKP